MQMIWERIPWMYFRLMGIEEEFDIQIEAEEAEHIVSVEDAVEAIKKKLAE